MLVYPSLSRWVTLKTVICSQPQVEAEALASAKARAAALDEVPLLMWSLTFWAFLYLTSASYLLRPGARGAGLGKG